MSPLSPFSLSTPSAGLWAWNLGSSSLTQREYLAEMERKRAHTVVLSQPVEMDGEQSVGYLRLPLGEPLVVAARELDVVSADR